LHQVGDLFELNVKLRFQKVKQYISCHHGSELISTCKNLDKGTC
jgi:hypothetical protein